VAFGCTPDVAERQDLTLVIGVLNYRSAKHAIELMGQGSRGFDELTKHPELGGLLMRMLRAQDLQVETPGDAVAAVAEQLNVDAEEED
jgi:hypothetical protein